VSPTTFKTRYVLVACGVIYSFENKKTDSDAETHWLIDWLAERHT
jgi:hypothetical protein